jgi:hypothetical protein
VFDFQHAYWNALHETLSHLDLAPGDSSDIDADWTKWKDLFLGAAAKHMPQKNSKCVPLLCGSTAKLNIFFKRKTLAEERAKQKSCCSLWEKYRGELRRKTKSIIYAKREKFFDFLPALLRSSTKKFWSIFKSVSKHSNVPNKMSWSHLTM